MLDWVDVTALTEWDGYRKMGTRSVVFSAERKGSGDKALCDRIWEKEQTREIQANQ